MSTDADILNVYNEWFKLNGSSPTKANGGSVFCGGQKFIFHSRLEDTSNSYRGVLGYAVVSGLLSCRFWYYSKSEASWRASTGLRHGYQWQKGYEGTGDNAMFTEMGYIFECYVTVDMHTALEMFWNRTDTKSPIIQGIGIVPPKKNVISRVNLLGPFLVDDVKVKNFGALNKVKPSYKAAISKLYNDERVFMVADLPLGDPESLDVSGVSSVRIQEAFLSKPGSRIVDVGKNIRVNHDIDSWLTQCLSQGKQSRGPFHHPILKLDYLIYEYALKDAKGDYLTVEIAATTMDTPHQYIPDNGVLANINTRVCWVRDVYYHYTPTTSFGTRKNIPINLSFLVQKPIDYVTQVSRDYLLSISDKVKHDDINNVFAMPKSTPEEIKSRNEAIYDLLEECFGDKGAYDKSYITLSYLNECTSTLLHEFKKINNIISFDTIYKKPIGPSLVSLKIEHNELVFFNMQKQIIIGINEYFCLRLDPQGYSKKGFHGDAGLERAIALREAISSCKLESELNRVVYNCFIKNKIDPTPSSSGFNGGFFSKVRTNPTSLFTCISRSLLSSSVVPPNKDGFTLMPSKNASMYPGDDKGIYRMKILIKNESGKRDSQQTPASFITIKSPELLVALKG